MIGVSLVGLGGITVREVQLITKWGFPTIALAPDNLRDRSGALIDEAGLSSLARSLKENGLNVSSLQGFLFGVNLESEDTLQARCNWINLVCEVLDVHLISLGAASLRVEKALWKRVLATLRDTLSPELVLSIENLCATCDGENPGHPWMTDDGNLSDLTLDFANYLECAYPRLFESIPASSVASIHVSGRNHDIVQSEKELKLLNDFIFRFYSPRTPITVELLGQSIEQRIQEAQRIQRLIPS